MSERNKDTKAGRIRKWLDGGEAPPWLLQIHPTNRCNLNCIFCWRGGDDERGYEEMGREKWLSIVRDACKMGIKKITVSGGGEPTLRPGVLSGISEIMEENRKEAEDIEADLITNGTLFDKNLIEKMVKNRWNSISFSVHASNSKTDDYLRGRKGSLQKTVENIKTFNRYKDFYNSEYPRFTIHMVLTKYNYNDILPMYFFCKELDVETFRLRLVNGGKDSSFFEIGDEIVETIGEQTKKAKKLAEDEDITVKQEFSLEELENELEAAKNKLSKNDEKEKKNDGNQHQKKPLCVKPFSELVILSDGSAHPCCVAAESQYHRDIESESRHIDNIRNKGLKEVWLGEKLQSLRRRMKRKDFPSECEKFCTVDLEYKMKEELSLKDTW